MNPNGNKRRIHQIDDADDVIPGTPQEKNKKKNRKKNAKVNDNVDINFTEDLVPNSIQQQSLDDLLQDIDFFDNFEIEQNYNVSFV